MRGAAAGSALASRTVPRERGRRNAEFSVTPGLRHRRDARLDAGSKPEMELNIRRTRRAVRVPEPAGLEQCRRHRTGLEQQILQPRPDRAMRLRHAIIGVIAGAFADRVEIEMVLHIGTDAGQIMNDRDPGCRSKRSAGPMPESCNNLGEPMAPLERITSRSASKRLDAARDADLHTDGAAVFNQYLQCRRVQS